MLVCKPDRLYLSVPHVAVAQKCYYPTPVLHITMGPQPPGDSRLENFMRIIPSFAHMYKGGRMHELNTICTAVP